MDRLIVYPGAIPLETDLLSTNRNAMIALGFLIRSALGVSTVMDGLAVTPTSPASLSFIVGQGSIISLSTVDSVAYGDLGVDSDSVMKMGVNAGTTSFTVTAPASAGQSINYLVEAQLLEADTTAVVLPYYNAANPAAPFLGPGNAGTAQNTMRTQRVSLQLKAGTPATTGSQTTPAVDAGWTGLAVVTVANGQTTVTSGNITMLPGAPLLRYKLPQLTPGFSNVQAYTSSGTFVVPPGVTKIKVQIAGAGGGAGGTGTTNTGGGGGGGGGYAEQILTVIPGQTYTVTIGTGGAGSSGNGTGGGTSSFSGNAITPVSATGGAAGSAFSINPAGGLGGVGSGGYLNLSGSYGSDGGLSVPSGGNGGPGAGFAAGGGRGGNNGGFAGSQGGGGGGGGYLSTAGTATGANGGDGLALVSW